MDQSRFCEAWMAQQPGQKLWSGGPIGAGLSSTVPGARLGI